MAKLSSHSTYHPSALAGTGLDGMGRIYSDKDYDTACQFQEGNEIYKPALRTPLSTDKEVTQSDAPDKDLRHLYGLTRPCSLG